MPNFMKITPDKHGMSGAPAVVPLSRRAGSTGLLALAFLAGTVALGPATAFAQTKFPTKPIRIIVPYGPGGVGDLTMRLLGQQWSKMSGQPVVIENKPGAGGRRAMKIVLDAAPDGHTLGVAGNGQSISASLYKKPAYDLMKDFSPVSVVATFDMHLTVKGDSKLKTMKDIVEAARKSPGKLNFGTVLPGSTQNLSAHVLRLQEKLDVTIITYKTTPDLITAILRGDVDVGFDFYAALAGVIQDKKVRIVATAGKKRTAHLPDVPTAIEAGFPYYVMQSWNGLVSKAGLSKDVAELASSQIKKALASPEVMEKAKKLGLGLEPSTPAEMTERFKESIARWKDVIEKAGIPKR